MPADHKEALKWLRMSADAGNATAAFTLGSVLDEADGVPKDPVEALAWFIVADTRAATDGTRPALRRDIVQSRDARLKSLTAAQVAQARRRAAEILGDN
jgi:Sel1 repeat